MKKLLAVALALAMVLSLAACANVGKWDKVHVDTPHYSGCYSISGYDVTTDGAAVVNTAEAGTLYLSGGTYVLIENGQQCPFCEAERPE